MAYYSLITVAACLSLFLQCSTAGYHWPDKVQQHKGYIDVRTYVANLYNYYSLIKLNYSSLIMINLMIYAYMYLL